MKKIICLVLMLCLLSACYNEPKRIHLVGVYRHEDQVLSDITFDYEDNYTFYFYNNGITEVGSFFKNDDGTFVIHSDSFDNAIVELSQDDGSIFVTLDGVTKTYEQISHRPVIREGSFETDN